MWDIRVTMSSPYTWLLCNTTMADIILIDGIDFLSRYEKILTANEQETCGAKIWRSGVPSPWQP